MKSEEALDRPFDEDVLAAATERAKNYIIKTEPNEDLGFVGHAMKFPTVFADGKTEEECRNSVREAIVASIATMIEMGQEEFIPD
jgi:predicted RNase H-like HicB family nuclease